MYNMNMFVYNIFFICMLSMEIIEYEMFEYCCNNDNKMNGIDKLIKCKLIKKRRFIV